MKRYIIYILFVFTWMLFACQKTEIDPGIKDGLLYKGKVPIEMSISLPDGLSTKAMGTTPDINSLHLIVFDENGMLVEIAEATLGTPIMTSGNPYQQNYNAILTLSDRPRIIHFIANCPTEQIIYGHEASIVSNLYVENGNTAYWARKQVPYLKVAEKPDAKGHYILASDLIDDFQGVKLLRNFAQIVITDNTGNADKFSLQGYTIYNTINKGTVAPYNNKIPGFQNFEDTDGTMYSYPNMMALEKPYEGHALSSAPLITTPPLKPGITVAVTDDDYLFTLPGEPFFMYERKVSVKTDDESKWNESPPHVIVKALYDGKLNYYKFDLVHNEYEEDSNGNTIITDIKYYNILRNFQYSFSIYNVNSAGYTSVQAAMNGATSNNLSGSTNTSKFTDVSDNTGRLWVSFTDTTLVSSGEIRFLYKYVPDIDNGTIDNGNESVWIEDEQGNIISNTYTSGNIISGATIGNNISTGVWTGYKEITFNINTPQPEINEQIIYVRTKNYKLSRRVRLILRKPYEMQVVCNSKILYGLNVPQQVDIKLPIGMTEDMFPLDLNIEIQKRSLSPNAEVSGNELPVTTGMSIIPGKNEKSFYFTKRIDSYEDYRNIPTVGNYKTIGTYWLTNMRDNASTIWVLNKYFTNKNATWSNVNYKFTDVSVTTANIPKGEGKPVEITFTMDATDNSYASRTVNLQLEGLKNSLGQSTLEITPVNGTNVTMNGRKVTVKGLTTASAESAVGFRIDNEQYMLADAISGDRTDNVFGITGNGFTPSSLGIGAGLNVTYQFDLPEYYDNMVINVTLDGLEPADDALQEQALRSTIKTYTYRPAAKGLQTLNLKTVNKDACTCYLTLEAEKYYYATVTKEINQAEVHYEFKNINVPSTVAKGTDKNVTIEFELDPSDPNRAGKKVNVTLTGMTLNGSTTAEVTANNNGKVTFTAKTTDANGPLSVTFNAAGYPAYTGTIQRTNTVTYSGSMSVTVNDLNLQHNRNNQNPTPSVTIKSITVNAADNVSWTSTVTDIKGTANIIYGNKYTLSSVAFKINDVIVSGTGLTNNTEISITVSVQYGNQSTDKTVNYKLSDIK